MLNSNFDLRSFLTESKAPKEVIQEATLTEATVMEYIREKMNHMNNEVRSCMKEYLTAVNEIDPGHEDAHAQLMGALEDFYNKLKAHFEEDAMDDAGEELATTEPAPSRELDGSPMIEGEEEEDEAFGGEEDKPEEELNEGDDYSPRDKEDLVYTFLQDAFKLGATKGDDYNPGEELSSMAVSLVANLPDYDSAEVGLDEDASIELKPVGRDTGIKLNIKAIKKHLEGKGYKVDYQKGGSMINPKGIDVFNPELGSTLTITRNGELFGDSEWGDEVSSEKEAVAALKRFESELKEYGTDIKIKEEAVNEDAGIYQGLVDTAMNMGSEKDTALFLAGLVKTVVHLGAVPALVAALYPFKDKPVVQKLLKKLEKFSDAD